MEPCGSLRLETLKVYFESSERKTRMTKFCVFCGESPQEKNKEHVLPEWLIEMTGDPKRIATFGYDFLSNPISLRQFSFDALAFPACARCNRRFGNLETKIKPIITRLLAHQPASSSDF